MHGYSPNNGFRSFLTLVPSKRRNVNFCEVFDCCSLQEAELQIAQFFPGCALHTAELQLFQGLLMVLSGWADAVSNRPNPVVKPLLGVIAILGKGETDKKTG